MFNLKNFLKGSLLALTLACGTVLATPISYHVDVFTGSFQTESISSGYLELSFISPGSASDATALVTNLSGLDGFVDAWGNIDSSVSGQYGFKTPFEAGLLQALSFGGTFGFDVTFDGPNSGVDGTRFTVSLASDTDYLAQGIVVFDLYPGQTPAIQASEIALVRELSGTPADVPEPSILLSMLSGLGLLGYARRRRV